MSSQAHTDQYSPSAGARHDHYPIGVRLDVHDGARRRLTVAFRPILAIPHLLLVGAPIGFVLFSLRERAGESFNWGFGTGALGGVAAVVALIAWFTILFTGRFPDGLYSLASLYLRWRVRAVAYMTLLTDEYPPFGDAPFPAQLILADPATGERDRVSVAFRLLLALPQIVVVAMLGVVWFVTTIVAWLSIIVVGRMPAQLYRFGAGMLLWTTRVEAYLLLLCDEYPPFSLD